MGGDWDVVARPGNLGVQLGGFAAIRILLSERTGRHSPLQARAVQVANGS
jgi:hypothetical protein